MIVTDPLFLAFLSFTFVFAATPGSTTAVVVRNTLDGGRHAGLFAALGAACANTTHATVAGLGGAALLRAWPSALEGIRLVGAGYLAFLGVQSAWQAVYGATPLVAALTNGRVMHHRSFREGLTVNLLGPATLTFYLAAVPTFIRPSWPAWTYALLAACHVGLAFACHSTWALALHRLRAVFRRSGPRRALGLATAAALLALAVRIVRQ
jgi:threonine/homoserine/homoserine lactone efflux protein